MKINLLPGYPATSEFLRSRIAIIARIPGYIYPDISPDTIHQPDTRKVLNKSTGGFSEVAGVLHTATQVSVFLFFRDSSQYSEGGGD